MQKSSPSPLFWGFGWCHYCIFFVTWSFFVEQLQNFFYCQNISLEFLIFFVKCMSSARVHQCMYNIAPMHVTPLGCQCLAATSIAMCNVWTLMIFYVMRFQCVTKDCVRFILITNIFYYLYFLNVLQHDKHLFLGTMCLALPQMMQKCNLFDKILTSKPLSQMSVCPSSQLAAQANLES